MLLWAVKPHDDGIEHGMVARMWNQASEVARTHLTTAASLSSALRVSRIETPVEALAVANGVIETTIRPCRMEAYSLTPR